MKKIICYVLFCVLLLSANVSVQAGGEISVVMDGKQLIFDQPPVIKNDRVFVPIRAIAEALEASVNWNEEEKSVIIMDAVIDSGVGLYIDSTHCSINGINSMLDAAPFIENGRTMVPVRLISQAFGCKVEWDGDAQLVNINTSEINSEVNIENNFESLKANPEKPLVCNGFTHCIEAKDMKTFSYTIPELNIKTDEAQRFSKQIETIIKPEVDAAIKENARGDLPFCQFIIYDYAVYANIVSIVVIVRGDYDITSYYSFNYDIASDKSITSEELIKLCGTEVTTGVSNIQNNCLRLFDAQYPPYIKEIAGEELYYQQRNAAMGEQCYNIKSPLYMNKAGRIYAIVNMPSLAGAPYYQYGIDTGLSIK